MLFIYTLGHWALHLKCWMVKSLQDEALGDSEATHQSEETVEPPGLRRFNLLTGEVERRRSGWGSGRGVVDQSEASEGWRKQSQLKHYLFKLWFSYDSYAAAMPLIIKGLDVIILRW